MMTDGDIDGLFAQTLQGDYDDHEPWDAVQSLRRIGTRQVFDQAVEWIESADRLERARGLDVIAQIGKTSEHPSNSFPQESYDAVVKALQRERELQPLNSAISALGHIDDSRAVLLIAPFHSHQSAEIRFTVACALGSFPNDPLSVRTLLTHMDDADADVCDWSTFGLGVLGDQDSPAIREALCQRLHDEDVDTRKEALVGLAKRHDTPHFCHNSSTNWSSQVTATALWKPVHDSRLRQGSRGVVWTRLRAVATRAVFRYGAATLLNRRKQR